MMKSVWLALLLSTILSGCASSHFVERNQDTVLFSIRLPDAERVQLASSTDNFALHDIIKTESGDWQATVGSVQELAYFYVVDGSVYLPDCQLKETDDFGSENCLFQP